MEKDSGHFGGVNIIERRSGAILHLNGYVSIYYAYYTDEITNNGMVQIPVMAPRNKQLGLNMAMGSLQYTSKNVRGNFALHYGDIPLAIWPSDLNMVQEANAGVRVTKGLWLDAGIFRSHIGVESIEPRENISSTTSLVNNYEPYYFTGAKLTYALNSKLSFQVNAFNSFNTLTETNKDKLLGFSCVFEPTDDVSLTYNFLTGDETPDTETKKHRRFYNNIYATLKFNKLTIAAEVNYGWQENSMLKDSSGTARVSSDLIIAKYQVLKKAAVYIRQEFLSDPEGVLTGSLNFGKNVSGTTGGVEYKPFKTVALSLEGRMLQAENKVFAENGRRTNKRYECILCLDVSF